ALVNGGTPAPDLSPSWQANAPPPAPPARRPTASAIDGSDASPPTQPPPSSATTRIRRTVVKAIVLGFVLQLVVLALATGLHMELARAVTFGVVLTLGFYGVVLAMVHARLGDSGLRPVWSIGPPGTALVTGVGVGALQAGVLIVLSSAVAGHLSADSTATTVAA